MERTPATGPARREPATREPEMPPGGWDRPPPAPRPPPALAGWWSRAGAAAIDAAVVCLPAVLVTLSLVGVVAGPLGGLDPFDDDSGFVASLVAVVLSVVLVLSVLLAVAVLYAPLTMRRRGRRNGQTWGKQLLGIRVIRGGAEPQTLASAALREVVVKLLLFGASGALLAGVPTVLDCLWPLWDAERRALHDFLADSHVVRV